VSLKTGCQCGLLWLPMLWLLMLGLTQQALAHTNGESYTTLSVRETGVDVAYNLRSSAFLQLADPGLLGGQTPQLFFQQELLAQYHLFTDGKACAKERIAFSQQRDFLRMTFQATCAEGELTLVNQAFYNVLPDQLHFARLVDAEGGYIAERVMDATNTNWLLPDGGPQRTNVLHYGWLGLKHILGGYDHLAFLATVLLLVSGLRSLAVAISGFTLGHSITLILAVTGVVTVDSVMIEALIGLTIALVAGEAVVAAKGLRARYGWVILTSCLLISGSALMSSFGPSVMGIVGVCIFYTFYLLACARQPALAWRLVPAVTFLFGLIHGFGFAGSLLEIGLPTTRLALSLLSFNIGIELGQLAVVLVTVACLTLFQRYFPVPVTTIKWARTAAASGLMGLGMFWFVLRAWA
jgi:hypothetical protein